MKYSERKKRARNNLRTIQAYFSMTRQERERAIIEEQTQRFLSRGGRIKKLSAENADVNFNRMLPVEAIDFLRA